MMVHMDRTLADNQFYASQPKGRQDLKFHREFEIKHYAGTVKYSIEGFMDKNKVSRLANYEVTIVFFSCVLIITQLMHIISQ